MPFTLHESLASFHITEEDLRYGERRNSKSCPLARRLTIEHPSILHALDIPDNPNYYYQVRVGSRSSELFTVELKTNEPVKLEIIQLSGDLIDWIQKVDKGEPVSPITVHLYMNEDGHPCLGRFVDTVLTFERS